jgi:DNA repair protein RadC
MRTINLREVRPVYRDKKVSLTMKEKLSKRIKTPRDAWLLFRDLQDEAKENVVALHLDSKNQILVFEVVSVGTINMSLLEPREVFGTSMMVRAVGVLLLHNHPSGDCAPSPEDKVVTANLKHAADILRVKLLDHIIVGRNSYFSFNEEGLL